VLIFFKPLNELASFTTVTTTLISSLSVSSCPSDVTAMSVFTIVILTCNDVFEIFSFARWRYFIGKIDAYKVDRCVQHKTHL